MLVDEILECLGRYGRWQIITFVLICIGFNWPVTWHLFAVAFIGAEPRHHCKLPANSTKNESLPTEIIRGKVAYSQCFQYRNATYGDKTSVPCQNGWTYEADFTSVVTEYDLVCARQIEASNSHMVMILGATIGAFLLTPLSDRFGRKPYFIGTIIMTGVFGVATAFSPNFLAFQIFGFFRGFFIQGAASAGLVMACEIFPSSNRAQAGTWVQAFWGMGLVILAGFGYFLRSWRHFMLGVSVPHILGLVFIWTIPESIQWLISRGEYEKAKQILLNAAKMNKVTIPEKLWQEAESDVKAEEAEADHEPINESTLAIFTAPRMRRYTYINFYLWLGVNLAYWGLALGAANLGGDMYVNFAINGAVEIPATFVCFILLPKIGRRGCLFGSNVLASIFLVTSVFIPLELDDGTSLQWAKTTAAMLGKFAISGAYLNLMFYTPELFPTQHRSLALGISFVIGLLAGVGAPYFAILEKYVYWLPGCTFAAATFVAGALTLLLPETVGRALPQSIREVQGWTIMVKKDVDDEKEKESKKSPYEIKETNGKVNMAYTTDEAGLKPVFALPNSGHLTNGHTNYDFTKL